MKKPNVLLFITDQHRADHLGCYGNTIVKTPNINTLAGRGTLYERFYVANPVCMPNRAALMTSRLPSTNGVYSNGTPLSINSRTFVDRLAEEGYDTALIGKSHLQTISGIEPNWLPDSERYHYTKEDYPSEAQQPDHRGKIYLNEDPNSWKDPDFQVKTPYYGFKHVDLVTEHSDEVGGEFSRWLEKKDPDLNERRGRHHAIPDHRITTPQAWKTSLPEELYPTSYIGQQTVKYLNGRTKGDDPFFVQCSFPDPHHPFTPPGKYWDMYDPDDIPLPRGWREGDMPIEKHLYDRLRTGNAQREAQLPYAANEREIREAIALTYGMITMIDDQIGHVMQALHDSGEADNTIVIFTTDHGDYMGDRGLLLKGPHHLHGLINVPFIWVDPTQPNPHKTSDLGQTIDIGPTILRRVGIKPDYGIQGRDLIGDPPLESILIEDSRQRVNLGFERFQGLRTLVTAQYRLTIGFPDAGNELFDLQADRFEHNNLFNHPDYAGIRAETIQALAEKMIAMQDPIPLAPFYA